MKETKPMEKARARAKAKAAKTKGKTKEPMPVRIVRDEVDAPSEPSSYQKERDAEKKENGGFDKYEIENACEALDKASKVLANKKLLAACMKHHGKKHEQIKSMAQLKAYANSGGEAATDEE